jgi:hypothetical protein
MRLPGASVVAATVITLAIVVALSLLAAPPATHGQPTGDRHRRASTSPMSEPREDVAVARWRERKRQLEAEAGRGVGRPVLRDGESPTGVAGAVLDVASARRVG